MSMAMDEEIERWTTLRKAAVVLGIIQGKITVAKVWFATQSNASR